jgi:hypothetical protein
VTDSTVSGNSAGNAELFSFSEGGGIFNNGTLTVTNSLVSGNSAASSERVVSNGGGIFNNGTLTVFSSTVSGNSTVGSGGGIYNFTLDFDQTTLTLINVTVTGNRADSGGSGEEHGGGIFTFGTETLNNTIVAGNFVDTFSSDVSGDWFDTANHNLFGTALGGIVNGVNGNKVGFAVGTVLDPNLADNGGPTRTHALISGSPAIDAGFANGASTDQRGVGFARTFDDPDTINAPGSDGTDIGAFERQNGFLQPVDNMPVLNEVKAGQTVPLKFSLGGFQGMAIIAPGYPATSVVGCNASQPTSTIEETSTTGNTVLTYDAATGRYQYNWKTRKEDSGKCQILTIQLIDGTVLMAKFRLK